MKEKTTVELINLLTASINIKNQDLINTYACELAKRLYVPGCNSTFEELMEGFGYRSIDKPIENQITIDEYIRTRKKDE